MAGKERSQDVDEGAVICFVSVLFFVWLVLFFDKLMVEGYHAFQ